MPSKMRREFVRGDRTVGYFLLLINRQDLLFRHSLQQITKTVDGDLVGNDQDALAPVVASDGVNHAAKTQDHIAPTLASRRPVIELAECRARVRLVWILLPD